MSTKYFHWDGDVPGTFAGMNYMDGKPVEHQLHGAPMFAIQGWHNVKQGDRQQIIVRLTTAGWVEGEQSKPDS